MAPRTNNEIQQMYDSGHRRFHCIHTQAVIDNELQIRHIESGFLGHTNDAQSFALMSEISENAHAASYSAKLFLTWRLHISIETSPDNSIHFSSNQSMSVCPKAKFKTRLTCCEKVWQICYLSVVCLAIIVSVIQSFELTGWNTKENKNVTSEEGMKERLTDHDDWIGVVTHICNVIFTVETSLRLATCPYPISSFYWALITMTTIGYGDIYPKTKCGQILTSVCGTFGLFLLSMPIAVVANTFTDLYKRYCEHQCHQILQKKHTWCRNGNTELIPIKY
ncbi:KCNB1 [Mytilus coruscus]|uniref:KCNB1 n=1 Tax=Mytilus coruscus TaxID=42192 RepID=A0A6J8EV44_MYTCO|nr:KCNB1 [Mytilus coruscus]